MRQIPSTITPIYKNINYESCGYFDLDKPKAVTFQYKWCLSFNDTEISAVQNKDGKWSFINSKLEPLTDFIYDDIERVGADNEFFQVNLGNGYGLLNSKLEKILEIEFESIDIVDDYSLEDHFEEIKHFSATKNKSEELYRLDGTPHSEQRYNYILLEKHPYVDELFWV